MSEDDRVPTLPYGLDSNQLQAPTYQMLQDDKVRSFTLGVSKKSPFQKHKEQAEARKKAQEDEAARVYAAFVESFASEESADKQLLNRAFVKGAEIVGGGPGGTTPIEKPVTPSSAGASTAAASSAGSGGGGSSAAASESAGGLSNAFRPQQPSGAKRIFLPPSTTGATPPGSAPPSAASASAAATGGGSKSEKKKRAIDELREEMKRKQEEQELRNEMRRAGELARQRAAEITGVKIDDSDRDRDHRDHSSRDIDYADPNSSNLYVSNLSPQVTEAELLRAFSKFGPIHSVKIMHPRTDEERRRGRTCGFVSFLQRADAEEARDRMHGEVLQGLELRIGWGKPMPKLPGLTVLNPPGWDSPLAVPPPTPLLLPAAPPAALPPAAAALLPPPVQAAAAATPLAQPPSAAAAGALAPLLYAPGAGASSQPQVVVVPPSDAEQLAIIHRLAMFVAADGFMFERLVMEREAHNDKFSFLFVPGPASNYYKWKVYSLMQGDGLHTWRKHPFAMYYGGPLWIPPASMFPPPAASPADDAAAAAAAAGGGSHRSDDGRDTLGSSSGGSGGRHERGSSSERSGGSRGSRRSAEEVLRDEFEELVRNVSLSRATIRDAMLFALDHADRAKEVVQVLTEALSLLETPIPAKLARLYLVSDILHNSSARVSNASAYRSCFEARLAEIFEAMHDAHKAITGRITAENLKEQVKALLRIWEAWSLYPPSFIRNLQHIFAGSVPGPAAAAAAAAAASAGGSASALSQPAPSDNLPVFPASAEDEDEELDGVPLEEPT